jgi:glycosyltransferase involved in cell wall biosynthesis
MSLVSVIIPVFNGEKTIKETIESVLNQTLDDLELIVIDDGSQDSTLNVISTIQDPRLKVFSYPNAGVSVSRNRGLEQAQGEYVSFIDADDLWTRDKLESQVKALQTNPKAAVAYSWTDWIDESGQLVGRGSRLTEEGKVFEKLLLNDFVGSGSNALIRKKVLEEVGKFDQSVAPSEDWDMWLRLANYYEFVAVSSPQVLYRVLLSSASFNVWKMEAASLRVIEKAFAIAPQSLQYLKRQCLGNRYKYLTFKALEGTPKPQRGWVAARFLGNAVFNDPSLLQTRVIWKVLLKIMAVSLLPPQQAQSFINKMGGLANIGAIFVHVKREPIKKYEG